MNPSKAASPSDPCHVVQLYGDDHLELTAGVARYLAAGYEHDQPLIVVATNAHEPMLREQLTALGVPVNDAERHGRLLFVDAREALEAFMVDGYPDEARFAATMGATARRIQEENPGRRLRGFGEMVSLLWERGQFPSAIRLEQLWNALQASLGLDLYCAYPIDIFGGGFSTGIVSGLLCTHSAIVAAERNDRLDQALACAIAACTGDDQLPARAATPRMRSRAALSRAEDTILWIRSNLAERAEEILSRARGEYAAG
jgi:hypothetical protein